MIWALLTIPTFVLAIDLNFHQESVRNQTVQSNHDKFYPVYFLNTSKILFETEVEFLSFSIDAASIRKGLNKTLLR